MNIKELKAGQPIETAFLLKKKETLKTKEGKLYLRLVFADKTGEIEGRMWDNVAGVEAAVDSGSVVIVSGTVDVWKNDKQIKVDGLRAASEKEYKPTDLIRAVENPEELFKKVNSYLGGISDKHLSILADRFLEDTDLMSRFKKSPGASSWHNAYIGGLLEHTYEVMYISERVCELYPQADKDLVLIGAFVHDIGKVIELDPNTLQYTLDGGLIGHLTLGFDILSKKISGIKDFPKDLELKLKHIILSHHGEYEQQSPVLPKTLEATIVYQADELTSQANAVKELIEAQSGGDKEWSNFVGIKSRKYLLKKQK
ncbi:MAG: HD domain-containing protein [Candidatus Omnitrophota bacterium]|nr:HD domain-containing protein [Candidatus Omnitrophota bacterium]